MTTTHPIVHSSPVGGERWRAETGGEVAPPKRRFFGLLFDDPEIERTFLAFHARSSRSAFRIGMLGSVVAWTGGSLVAAWIFPEYARSYLLAGWGLMLPLLLLGFLVSKRERWVERLVWWSTGLNILAGVVLIVLVDFGNSTLRGVGLGLIILVAFFSFTIFRLRFLSSLGAVLFYYGLFQAQLTSYFLRGEVGTIEHAGYTFVLWVTFGVGGFVVASLERSWREAYVQSRVIERQQESIQREKAKSEALLLNILPGPVADRLKSGESVIADGYEEVSVLFADIVGFTPLSQEIEPQRLVGLLDRIFSQFDELCDDHGVEKIKTIGDAYMAAAGVPIPCGDSADRVAGLALAMMEKLDLFREEEEIEIEMRMGLHTGPVVAGVIGRRKFAYDLWGDAVNTAARMESHGRPGEIQVTKAFRDRLQPGFHCVERGRVEIKGKGDMTTFLLQKED